MQPKDSYVLLNNLRFHYRDWGGAGQPMVLVHGLASNARIWDLVAPALAQEFRVLALDQRSHGRTDPATSGFDFPSIVRDLHAFIEALDLHHPILVGHSWGASTVLHYAALRPNGPAGIVLVDGGLGEMSAAPGMTWEKAEVLLMPPDIDGMPRTEFLERMKGWAGDAYSETVADIVLANFTVTEEDTLRRPLRIPYHMQIARALYEQKLSELYPRVRCPLLICPAIPPTPHDERTTQFVALKQQGAEQAQRANDQARLEWFEETVHDVPLHRPERLGKVLSDFGRTCSDYAG